MWLAISTGSSKIGLKWFNHVRAFEPSIWKQHASSHCFSEIHIIPLYHRWKHQTDVQRTQHLTHNQCIGYIFINIQLWLNTYWVQPDQNDGWFWSHEIFALMFVFRTILSSCWCIGAYSCPLCFMRVLEIWFYDYMTLVRASQGKHIFSFTFCWMRAFQHLPTSIMGAVSCVVPVFFPSRSTKCSESILLRILLFCACDNKIVRELEEFQRMCLKFTSFEMRTLKKQKP